MKKIFVIIYLIFFWFNHVLSETVSEAKAISYNEPTKRIYILEDLKKNDQYIFHAGTKLKNNKIYTAGGRVLGVTAKGDSLKNAKDRAYDLVKDIKFKGMQYRTDIGKKALKKDQ